MVFFLEIPTRQFGTRTMKVNEMAFGNQGS
jgi:hypothetical protein